MANVQGGAAYRRRAATPATQRCLHNDINAMQAVASVAFTFNHHFANTTTMMTDFKVEGFSSDDEVVSDTDVEQFIISEDWSLKEYYLGATYFDFAIAKQALQLPDNGSNWPELHVRKHDPTICRTY